MPKEIETVVPARPGLGVLLLITLMIIVSVTASTEQASVPCLAKTTIAAKYETIVTLHEHDAGGKKLTSGNSTVPAENAMLVLFDGKESKLIALLGEGRELLDSRDETLVQQDHGKDRQTERYSIFRSKMTGGAYEIAESLLHVGQKHLSSSKSSGPLPVVKTTFREALPESQAALGQDPCQNVSNDGATMTLCRTESSYPIFNISFIQRMGLLGVPCRTLCSLPPTYVSPRLFSEDACEKSCVSVLAEPCMRSTCTRTMCPTDLRFVANACKKYCNRVLREFGNPASVLFLQRYWAFRLCEACLRVYPYSSIPDCAWGFELWRPVAAYGSQQNDDTCRVRGRFMSSYFDNSRVLEYV
jgi:hypothetical protein